MIQLASDKEMHDMDIINIHVQFLQIDHSYLYLISPYIRPLQINTFVLSLKANSQSNLGYRLGLQLMEEIVIL